MLKNTQFYRRTRNTATTTLLWQFLFQPDLAISQSNNLWFRFKTTITLNWTYTSLSVAHKTNTNFSHALQWPFLYWIHYSLEKFIRIFWCRNWNFFVDDEQGPNTLRIKFISDNSTALFLNEYKFSNCQQRKISMNNEPPYLTCHQYIA